MEATDFQNDLGGLEKIMNKYGLEFLEFFQFKYFLRSHTFYSSWLAMIITMVFTFLSLED